MAVDPATAAQRYAAAASTAQTRWTEGIQASTKDPGQLAAQSIQKYIQNVNQAAQSGYTARRMIEGSAKWKPNSLAKAANYGTGVNQAQGAYQAGYTAFFNAMAGTLNQIQSMPKNTPADSLARMTAWFNAASAYQKP